MNKILLKFLIELKDCFQMNMDGLNLLGEGAQEKEEKWQAGITEERKESMFSRKIFKVQLILTCIKMDSLTTTSFIEKSILWIFRTLIILSILLILSNHGLDLVTVSFGFIYQIRIFKIILKSKDMYSFPAFQKLQNCTFDLEITRGLGKIR